MESADQLKRIFDLIDDANASDPNRETYEGTEYPKEQLYSIRMTSWLDRIEPTAPDYVKIAARAQHICRWQTPRKDYPMNKAGYLKWRTGLYKFHADKTSELMGSVGYSENEIERASSLLLKKNLKKDSEMQLLEDVICLVFLEFYFDDFTAKHDEAKMVSIVKKTWRKMSERGHEFAGGIAFSAEAGALVQKALETKKTAS